MATAKTKSDLRGAPRLPVRWQVEMQLAEQPRRVYTTNVSSSGLMFSLAAPASVPAELDLALELPDGQHVTLTTAVRHVARRAGTAEFDVGVQFASLQPEQQTLLQRALASQPA